MSKIVKITQKCPKCGALLIIQLTENDLGKSKQIACQACKAKYNVPIPLTYASKFETDPTLGGNEAEQTIVLETIANDMTAYQCFNLTSEYYTIGRKNNSGPEYKPDVEVVTTDKKMSRIHAAIRKKGKAGFTLSQLPTGKNGVFLKGSRLDADEEVYLSDGDTFRLGESEFRVNIAEHSDDLTQS